jgi:hypothetical protein
LRKYRPSSTLSSDVQATPEQLRFGVCAPLCLLGWRE